MWQRGVAKVVKIIRDRIVVRCPHCGDTHEHSYNSLGSKEVIAGCHKGYTRCFSYSIPRRSR